MSYNFPATRTTNPKEKLPHVTVDESHNHLGTRPRIFTRDRDIVRRPRHTPARSVRPHGRNGTCGAELQCQRPEEIRHGNLHFRLIVFAKHRQSRHGRRTCEKL